MKSSSPSHLRLALILNLSLGLNVALQSTRAHAQAIAAPAAVRPDYRLIRSDEDWSFLADPAKRSDLFDPMKYIAIRKDQPDWYLSLGGEIREVYEQIGNDNWGQQAGTNGYLLQRYMLHSDLHLGEHARFFLQVKSGIENGRNGGPRPIDEDRLDFLAGFLDITEGSRSKGVTVRVGRQEIDLGSERLVSVREGPNVRQSFDGARITGRLNQWTIDGFALRPDSDSRGIFDDRPISTISFWGVYASRALQERRTLDAYYLGIDRKHASIERGTARDDRHTLGVRYAYHGAPPYVRSGKGFDGDYEAAVQFGTFGSNDIFAWTIASETGWQPSNAQFMPHLHLRADVASGDNPKHDTVGTFFPYFPIGNYFRVFASTGPGPVNFSDLHPGADFYLPHHVVVAPDWLLYWRENTHDGVYSVPGNLIRPAGGATAKFVGNRPGVEARWQIDRHAYLQADYGVFLPGDFLKQTQPARNLSYMAFWAGYKF